MENLEQFNKIFIKKIDAYYARTGKIAKQITDLEVKRNKLKYPLLMNVIKSIAEEIKKRLKASGYVRYGSFGMCCENTIYWLKDMKKSITDEENVLGNLCLINSGQGWDIRDTTKDTKSFASNSIGAANGMNHPTIQIDETMDIDWLVNFVTKT